jgi:pimeloyl-ACP methyl ester carboxylesterase
VFLQGIACESVDCATGPEAPLAALIEGWHAAGYDTLRFDKRGVGDSEGPPCDRVDFTTELADARAVVEYAGTLAAYRSIPLVLFGHSVGAIMAAQLASACNGVIVYGAPVTRWIDCLLDSTRRQMSMRGARSDEIERSLEGIRDLARTGELNGRSAAYHEQLHDLDLEAAWRAVTVPVLVVRGEFDWVVDADDQARIAKLARRAEIIDIPGLDHLFGRHPDHAASLLDYGAGAADRALVEATLPWLDRLRSRA